MMPPPTTTTSTVAGSLASLLTVLTGGDMESSQLLRWHGHRSYTRSIPIVLSFGQRGLQHRQEGNYPSSGIRRRTRGQEDRSLVPPHSARLMPSSRDLRTRSQRDVGRFEVNNVGHLPSHGAARTWHARHQQDG